MTEPHHPNAIASAAALSLDAFISRWQDADGCELANYQLFITDLCQLLGVPAPDPARDDTRDNAYVFERRVTFRHGDGSESTGRIDCYKRSAYVLEAKKVRLGVGSKVFDDAMQRARGQAEGYARALPAEEGRPPFLIVIGFLTRCLFSMFAEDVGLLPKQEGKGAFSALLATLQANPQQFVPLLAALWREMDSGGFSVVLRATLPRFNGKLFKQPEVIALDRDQIGLLIKAANADWTQVEPAIFGTLLERALSTSERHALGAHYTPRAYVERLVLPTVVEPLRSDWRNVQAAALLLANEGRLDAARAEVDAFHHRLCQVRVLDPACGSANFLYVTLEHLKRLEGEVLDQLHAFGRAAGGSQQRLEAEGLTVDPHQFLGLELNPRAAAIAELVLWIGYLQWHFRTNGSGLPPQPILKDFRNIECRDAVLACDAVETVLDECGQPVSRWDGVTTKPHPVTGEPVPDENARLPLQRYLNPRKAEWPQADFIVGNPPFIGNKRMRDALGDGYVEALRGVWKDMPESADFVMFWWNHAAQLLATEKTQRFGLITTNSLTQTFNRRVVQGALDKGISLAFAIPDHPWVDSADGAAVRIAMTVGTVAGGEGRLLSVIDEREGNGEGLEVTLQEQAGVLHADLRVGANVAAAKSLRANSNLSNRGMIPHGEGFLVSPQQASLLDGGALLRPYRNGKDLTDHPRGVMVIDTFGLSEAALRQAYPATWQWLHDRVKPDRDQNPRKSRRENWWLFGENQPRTRASIARLPRYIVTGQTAKHRLFQFLDGAILPDDKLIAIALHDSLALGVLSSSTHVVWALATGARLGVGNDPVYNKSRCFEAFPFPTASDAQQARIRDLAEQLDAHRKRQQAAHPALTLTGMYNVLEKLRRGEALNAKDKTIHEQGLVSVLKSLHDELDADVLDAYGWSDLAPPLAAHADAAQKAVAEERLLVRLVALNAERAAEEAKGYIRWLRPDYQQPSAQPRQADMVLDDGGQDTLPGDTASALAVQRLPWPATLPEQVAAVARLLTASPVPLSEAELAARFTGKGSWKKRLPQIVDTLEALGRVRRQGARVAGVGEVSGAL